MDSPVLCTATLELRDGDTVVDEDAVAFGIRRLKVSRGPRVDRRPVGRRGACQAKEALMTENPVERGAAEDEADAPLTETEVEASERSPSGESGRSASEADAEGGGSAGAAVGEG